MTTNDRLLADLLCDMPQGRRDEVLLAMAERLGRNEIVHTMRLLRTAHDLVPA
jgi:hypothetical protein